MNNWKAVGCIFLVFGLLCFVVGLIAGNAAANANPYIASIDPSASQALFMNSFEPYAITSLFMFAIGAVGLYAGRTSQAAPTTAPTYSQSSVYSISSQVSSPNAQLHPPDPKVWTCPHCGQAAIFIEEYQRWYCVQEKKYV
ncbi:MAG: hypothetical protein ABSC20_10190 [Candidatus Bathyarchaeia archaeon]|jgi:hypothetical protein